MKEKSPFSVTKCRHNINNQIGGALGTYLVIGTIGKTELKLETSIL